MPTEKRDYYYGLNYADPRRAKDRHGAHEAQACKNVRFYKNGGLFLRAGRAQIGDCGEQIHSLATFVDYNDSEYLLIGAYDKIYVDPSGGGSPVVSLTGLTAEAKLSTHSMDSFLFVANGSDRNRKFDGTAWSYLGQTAPAAAPTVVADGAGVHTGDFQYVYQYVYVNAALGYEAESRISAIAEVTFAANKAKISVIADPSGQATYIRVRRRSSNAATFRGVPLNGGTSVNLPNTTADYTDNYADTDLLAEIEYPNEGEPQDEDLARVNFDGVTGWKSRLWGWKGKYLYPSVAGRPEKFYNDSSAIQQPIEIDNEEPILRAFPYGNRLMVYTANKTYMVTGDAEPWYVILLWSDIGLKAKRSIQNCNGWLIWLSANGAKRWDGVKSIPDQHSLAVDTDYHGYNRGILDNAVSRLVNCASAWVGKENEYWLAVPENSSTYNKKAFVDIQDSWNRDGLSSWTEYNFGFIDAVVMEDGRIITASGLESIYRKEYFGVQDNGADVTGYWQSREWHLGTIHEDKRLFEVTAHGYTTGSAMKLITGTYVQGVGWYTDEIQLTATTDVWGPDAPTATTDVWGTDSPDAPTDWWAEGTEVDRTLTYPQESTGSWLFFKIELDKAAFFSGFEIDYKYIKRANV